MPDGAVRRVFRLGLGRGHALAREVDDELAFHLAMRIDALVAAGMSPADARREALRQFGDVESVRRDCVTLDHERERAMRRANYFDELRQDLAYGLRVLRRNVGFTVVLVLTLALGIGANGAIFTLVDAVLLRPLPVREPDRLLALGDPSRTSSLSNTDAPGASLYSAPLYRDVRERSAHLFTGLLASGRSPRLDVSVDGGAAEHPRGRFVSANYFQVLGVPAGAGRVFDGSEDDAATNAPVVVIGDGWWERRFGRDPKAIGREIVLNGLRVTIIGVAPPEFSGDVVGRRNDLWIPLGLQEALMPNERLLGLRSAEWLLLLGRLAPGVTPERARTELTTIVRRALAAHPLEPGQERSALRAEVPISSGARGFSAVRRSYQAPLLILMAGVGLLLLIICANIANLLLARAVARAREMSVRLAIGARRGRLVRQLLTESLVLAFLGAAAGLLIAWGGSHGLMAMVAGGGSFGIDPRPDARVLAFTAGIAVLSVALFGLVPALRASRIDLASTMRATAGAVRGGGMGRGRRVPLGAALIASQVALSLVLLVGAALLSRSLARVQSVETGLDRDRLLVVDVDARTRGYAGDRLRALAAGLAERFARVPGVAAVSWSENGIFSGSESATTIHVPGFEARTADDSVSNFDLVGPGYVRALGARLVRGRDFAEADMRPGAHVTLVNEAFARHYFAGGDPVGRTITADTITYAIVGLIGDVRDHQLDVPPPPRFYLPYAPTGDESPGLRFEVRTTGAPSGAIAALRRELLAADASFSPDVIDPVTTLMRSSIRESLLLARLASGFGALALLLAAVGLYGVMTYAITRRTGEIGLRVALGATRGRVVALVLGDALRLVLAGVVLGIPLSIAAARLLRSQLFGVEPADPASLVVALAVLGGSAALAALIPALRASRVAPLVALRQE